MKLVLLTLSGRENRSVLVNFDLVTSCSPGYFDEVPCTWIRYKSGIKDAVRETVQEIQALAERPTQITAQGEYR